MHSLPIGYLITALLVAVATLSSLAPRRMRILGPLRLYLGHINELPFLAMLWLIASNWIAFSEGDVQSPVGWLALGLSVLSIAVLVLVIWRALPTATVMSHALNEGLGPEWQSKIPAKVAAQLRRSFSIAPLFGPLFIQRLHVKRKVNVSYGDAGGKNRLDIYYRTSRPNNCPVLVYFHGGALMGGSKNYEGLPLLYQLASHGWVCISANYRLSPKATFPDHLIDVKKVLAWVRVHAQEYGANPQTVLVAGSSSGAQLAALAALTPNEPKLQPGFESANTSVAAAITLYGDYDWLDTPGRAGYLAPVMKSTPTENPERWAQASPLYHVRQDAPPFLVIHGDQDMTLPVENARRFTRELRRVSQNPVVYAELPGAQHVFDMFRSIRGDAVANGIEAFADWVRTAQPRSCN
jgi:acetyl esterase/lipase